MQGHKNWLQKNRSGGWGKEEGVEGEMGKAGLL